MNLGGGSAGKHSELSKLKMAIGKIGTRHSAETREKISKSHEESPRIYTDEIRAKISASLKKAMSRPEVRERLSEIRRGSKRSQETKDKMSKAQLGKIASDEAKLNMAQSKRDNWTDPEYRAKMVAAHTGRKASPETRAKMAAAHRRRWEAKRLMALESPSSPVSSPSEGNP